MVPLLVPKDRPLGSAGLMAQEVTVPPPGETVFGVINWSLVRVMFSGEYEKAPGAASIIVRLIVVEDEPLALLAVIVYIIGVSCRTVGVPLITPLLKVRPLGRVDGEIDHVVGAPMIPFPALLTLYSE